MRVCIVLNFGKEDKDDEKRLHLNLCYLFLFFPGQGRRGGGFKETRQKEKENRGQVELFYFINSLTHAFKWQIKHYLFSYFF